MANYDSSIEQEKKKHNYNRMIVTNKNLEATYKPTRHRKCISKFRRPLKMHDSCKGLLGYIMDDGNECEDDTPLKTKSQMHKLEENKKLSKEDDVQIQQFNKGINSSRIREKHFSKDTSRIAGEYQKLEKRYKSVQEECHKLSNIMEKREAEYQQVCSYYEALIKTVQEMEETKVELIKFNQKLQADKVQSNEDIMLLKNIVYQLNAELERYQDKLKDQKFEGSSINFARNSGREERYNQRIWGRINFHVLGPLLNAYRENLMEKQELVNMYQQEMADFSNRCKEILMENELMHKEVEDLKSECNRYEKEIKSMVVNTASLKKQNDVLRKEMVDLKKEINEIRSSYELKLEVTLKHNEMLKREHTTVVSDLSNLRGKYDVLSKQFETIKSREEQTMPTSIHNTAMEECKMLLDELKHRYEIEKRNLSNQIKRIEENQPENEKQFVMITAERNHLKTLVKNLEKNLKRTQRKAEHVQNVLYSTRVSRDSLKEQLSKATTYCENLFSEYERIVAEREKLMTFLRETEKENASIDRLGKTITSRVDNLKNQLESVRKGTRQQVETVEKRIKLQELQVSRMKREYHRKIQYLKDSIKQKEDTIDKLQNQKRSD